MPGINMAEIEFEEKRLHALCQQKDRRIEAFGAELAAANAKIERYEHWIFSCNDCGPAEYAQRRLLSPQGSLAGSPIQAKDDQC